MNLFPAKTEQKMPKEIKRRLYGGLIVSLLVHAFILSLQFGLPGLGLPGMEAPWNKRRAESPAITIQIANSTAASSNSSNSAASTEAINTANTETPVVASSAASSEAAATLKPVQEVKPRPKPLPEAAAASAVASHSAAAAPGATAAVESKAANAGIRLIAPQKASPAPSPVQARAVNKPRIARKAKVDVASPLAQQRKVQPPDVPRVITQDNQTNETFAMAVPNPDDLPKKAEPEPDPKKQYDDVSQAGVEEESPQEKEARAQEKEQKRKKREELSRKQAKELAQQAAADGKQQLEKLSKQLDEDNRKQADETSRQQAAALALQKQLEAEEQNRRAQREAAAAEEIKLAEQKRQEESKREEEERQQRARQAQLALAQAQKEQQQIEQKREQQREQQEREQKMALEAEKRKEEEQRQQAALRQKQADEQIARQKNEELAARQKADELAARQKADEQAARQRAEQVAAEQRARDAAQAQAAAKSAAQAAQNAAAAAANNHAAEAGSKQTPGTVAQQSNGNTQAPGNGNNQGNSQGNQSDPFTLPKNILGSDLANKAREQARGLDLLRGTPPAQKTDLLEKPQRRSLFGSQVRDVPVRLYIDSWKQKIERNGNLNYSQVSKDRSRGDPVVVVLVRSDGSIEDITILRSSGRADIDEAVRRIVRLNAKYAAFPPNIAAQYDVIEIRHIWNFDDKLRLIEELR